MNSIGRSWVSTVAWQEADSGTYTCVVTSATGESSWSGVLTVRGASQRCLTFFPSHFALFTPSPLTQESVTKKKKKNPKPKPQHVPLLLRRRARERFSCVCNRERSAFGVQSLRVHSAAGASAEACRDGGDQEHRHPHLAVQPPRGRSRRHLLHHRGLQVHVDACPRHR